ncbi:unnamed protein product, partial [marine sediment metagenome]
TYEYITLEEMDISNGKYIDDIKLSRTYRDGFDDLPSVTAYGRVVQNGDIYISGHDEEIDALGFVEGDVVHVVDATEGALLAAKTKSKYKGGGKDVGYKITEATYTSYDEYDRLTNSVTETKVFDESDAQQYVTTTKRIINEYNNLGQVSNYVDEVTSAATPELITTNTVTAEYDDYGFVKYSKTETWQRHEDITDRYEVIIIDNKSL